MPKGPDFPKDVIETLAKRANQFCSRPDCFNKTSGPHSKPEKFVNLGEAAHIRGARPGAARYDPNMTDAERSDISNGIWLCNGCATQIDKDEERFPVKLLHIWKDYHENTIDEVSGKGIKMSSDTRVHEELLRVQQENAELRQELKSLKDFKSQYELRQTPGGAWVYVSLGEPPHYACQSCWDNKGNREILCDLHTSSGYFECPGCKNEFRVNPSQHVPQTRVKGGLGKHGWMR